MPDQTRVFITGIAGMLGSHIADECLRRGFDVHGVDNLVSGKREYVPEGAVFTHHDIRRGIPDYHHFDYVIHAAALPFIPDSFENPAEFADVNIGGTINVLRGCKAVKRAVVISSSEVYGSAQATPMTEGHPRNPQSPYAASKMEAENVALAKVCDECFPVVVFRPFNTFGPRSCQPYVIPEIIKQLIAGPTVSLGNLGAQRDFSFVTDTARAIVECALHGEIGEVYHYGSGVPRSIESIVEDIAITMGVEAKIVHDATKLRPTDVELLHADPSKLMRITDPWEPVSWEDGLAKTIEWFKAQAAVTAAV